MAARKVPIRKCIACGTSKPKKELRRIVRTPEREVLIDPKGKVSGRGAYICPSDTCFETALKKKAITRALEVELSENDLAKLQSTWQEMNDER